MIIVMAFLAVLILMTVVIVNMGCSEILQTRARSDSFAAYYAAVSGAESMRARLTKLVALPYHITGEVKDSFPSGQTVGTFTADADKISGGLLAITSVGNVRGHTARVLVKYKYTDTYSNGSPLSSKGPIDILGHGNSFVRINTGIVTGGKVTKNDNVLVAGDIDMYQPMQVPHFWWKYDPVEETWTEKDVYDTLGTGSYITDVNEDTVVTIADALGDPIQEAIFAANDINGDGFVNNKDAFTAYYTVELNKMGLGIGPGEPNYYGSSQVLIPGSIEVGKRIIFIEGNLNQIISAPHIWSGGRRDLTVVATGEIHLMQPQNGEDDRLTCISFGDASSVGVGVGKSSFLQIKGNLNMYSNGFITLSGGGSSNGTIFAKQGILVDTVSSSANFNRDINEGTDNWWNDPDMIPLGMPQGFNIIPESPNMIDKAQPAVWERN